MHFLALSLADFLNVLSDWFGIDINLLGSVEEKRLFLQYAIPMFKLRGTAMGLKLYLYIMTGVVPEIIEGFVPFSSLEIMDGTNVNSTMLEEDKNNSVFTVHFPVYREEFDDNLIRRIMLVLQQEKPVNTDCYISFKQHKEKERKAFVITENTDIGIDMEF